MLYSKSENAFFSKEVHGNSAPADSVEITREKYLELLSDQSRGKVIAPDANGRPVSINQPAGGGTILESVKKELRFMRAPMLDALTGIAGRAARAGNDALALEADALAEQLLDITDDPALNAATTYEAMQAAGIAAYRRIAGNSSPGLASVFKEITGV